MMLSTVPVNFLPGKASSFSFTTICPCGLFDDRDEFCVGELLVDRMIYLGHDSA